MLSKDYASSDLIKSFIVFGVRSSILKQVILREHFDSEILNKISLESLCVSVGNHKNGVTSVKVGQQSILVKSVVCFTQSWSNDHNMIIYGFIKVHKLKLIIFIFDGQIILFSKLCEPKRVCVLDCPGIEYY